MHDFVSIFPIEIPSGFISYDDTRMVYECTSNTGSLYFSPWECLDKFILLLEETYFWEYFWNSLRDDISCISTDFHGKCYIFTNCFARKELKILKNNSHTSTIFEEFFRGEFCDISSCIILDGSFFWLDSTDHRPYNTCFSTSRCTDKEYEFSWSDLDIYIPEDTAFPIGECYMWKFHKQSKMMLINWYFISEGYWE